MQVNHEAVREDEDPQHKKTAYDFIVDLSDPNAILKETGGYSLFFPKGKAFYDKKISQETNNKWFMVNVVGRYNVGKTYLVHLIAGVDLGHSFLNRTQSVSVSLPISGEVGKSMIALIDTAGSKTPVRYKSDEFCDLSYKRQVSDSFIQEVAFNSAEFFIFVLNQLTLDDQLALRALCKRLKEKGMPDSEIKRRLILVHNYFNLCSTRDADRVASYELEELFGATKIPNGYWISDSFRHFVLINNNCEDGQQYNQVTKQLIQSMIQGNCVKPITNALECIITTIKKQIEIVFERSTPVIDSEPISKPSGMLQKPNLLIKVSGNEQTIIKNSPVEIELQVQQKLSTARDQDIEWIICSQTQLPSDIALSPNLRFKEDGTVYVDHSSSFIPVYHIGQLNDQRDMQILIDCPACDSSTITHRFIGYTIRIKAQKPASVFKKNYANTRSSGQFEIDIPVSELEKNVTYDLTRISMKYENGVIKLTVPAMREKSEIMKEKEAALKRQSDADDKLIEGLLMDYNNAVSWRLTHDENISKFLKPQLKTLFNQLGCLKKTDVECYVNDLASTYRNALKLFNKHEENILQILAPLLQETVRRIRNDFNAVNHEP